MTGESTIERIIRANPVPDVERVLEDADELGAFFSSFQRRRDEMIDLPESKASPIRHPTAPWYRRPLAVAAAAALVVLAVVVPVAWLARRGEGPVATVPTTTEATVPTVPTTTEATGPTTEPAPAESAPPDATSMEPPAEPAVEFDEVLVPDRVMRNVAFEGDGEGSPIISYWYENRAEPGSGLGLLRCRDARCVEFDVVEIPYTGWPPLGLLAFLADGSPVFVGELEPPGDWGEDNPLVSGIATLFVCSDPSCDRLEPTPLETADDLVLVMGEPRAVIGDDGLPVLYAQSGAPPATPQIIRIRCLDRQCADREVDPVIDGAYLGTVTTAANGSLVLGVDVDAGQAVTCADVLCDGGASLVPLEAQADLWPTMWTGYVADVGSSLARVCSRFDPWCDDDRFVDLGREAWDLVFFGRRGDGRVTVLFATPLPTEPALPGELWLATCTDAACSRVSVAEQVATVLTDDDFAAGRWVDDGRFALWVSDTDPPLVAYGAFDGLHVVRCPDAKCSPPG